MSSHPSLLVAGGLALGAAAAAAALIRGERISRGQKALIAAVLLAAPGYLHRARRVAPPVRITATAPFAVRPAADAPDHLRRDIALRPVGQEGQMSPARFRIVDGQIMPYALLEDGSWGLLPSAGHAGA